MMENELVRRLRLKTVIFDGAMGTELYKRNFFVNASYENLCLSNPRVVQEIHLSYKNVGAEVLVTNSYGANVNKQSKFGLGDKVEAMNRASVELARKVAGPDLLVAGSVGPFGEWAPGATPSLQRMADALHQQAVCLADAGADFILFETASSRMDLEAALLAAEHLPCPCAINCMTKADGSLAEDGFPIKEALALIHAAGAPISAFGLNCGQGPDETLRALEILKPLTELPLIVRPAAGMPKRIDDRMITMCSPEYFTTYALRYAALGARGIGGCCGTTPEHIRDMARSVCPYTKAETHTAIFETRPEAEPKPEIPMERRSSFGAKLKEKRFVCTVEVVPPQGFSLEQTIRKAKTAAEAGFDAINIPDGPRASSRVSALATAFRIQNEAGIEAIVHQCCRDRNLIGQQSDLLGAAALGIANFLFITGDPPKLGDYPFASAVFDVDSIGIIKLQKRLNRGLDLAGKAIDRPTAALIGAGADPNAIDMEREIRRTREKIEAGAEFIVTQPVFDVAALLRFMDSVPELETTPLIAGIWPLASLRNAEFMKKEVPGVVVPDSILLRMASRQTKEEQREEGIAIAREAIDAVRDRVSGVQISAPFGNVETSIKVAENVLAKKRS